MSDTAKNREKSLRFCTAINRVLLNAMCPSVTHLEETQVDIEPRHEAFWFVGGMEPTISLQKARRGRKLSEEDVMESTDRQFQYEGNFVLRIE